MPKWFIVPPGVGGPVSVQHDYYSSPFQDSARFTLLDPVGNVIETVTARGKELAPRHLREQRSGFDAGYPAYYVVTIRGVTDIVEHRKMEPIFYMTDDPAVWMELVSKR